ncbi:uncharacterized protein N7496_009922 [Penicillium cataractarum]|uniref:J domain-containing protein n=1 Tax=Penicillium cataractarum TaxID=2100454 RepID=A0A9W9V1F4_9EURO|nr:uncharacterized protein N7496_009922 [Penicillium cataractarum]KAJ5364209.1 hypothetical protein N7496_009922 [Penicillium cataractarum]
MISPPDLDPYVVLGVSKDATVSEIRAAHRKRVLKCHPDKVQDESQRIAAQDEFQRVQQAYETLSDETRRARYDQKAKLAELKRELLEKRRRTAESTPYSSPRGSGSGAPREVREGRVFEERVPVDNILDEELRYTEEPRSMSRKYEEFGMRSKSKSTDEKKARAPTSSHRAAKEQRETTKAKLADQAKQRDRERRSHRQASAKYDTYDTLAESDSGSESSGSEIYVRLKKPTYRSRESRETRESRESRSRPTESVRHRGHSYDDDDDEDGLPGRSSSHKLHRQQYEAEEHIHRSKHEGPRGSRSPQRHRGYESAEPEMNTSRRTARSSRSARNQSSSRNNSWEDLDSPRREREEFKVPKMPSSSTSPAYKSSIRPSLFGARATTSTGFTRPKRESSSRDETILDKMVREAAPRSSRRYDSGYSSPSTPEIPARGSSPSKTATRYKIVDPVIIEPSKASSKYRSVSPERARMTPKRASTFATFDSESPRIEVRSVRSVRTYDDVEYTARPRAQDVQYTREIRPNDVHVSPGRSHYYNDPRHPSVGRRQSTFA